ncbi:hypothetical protein Z043-108462 [Arapaima gigas]
MDVLQEANLTVPPLNLSQTNGVDDNGSHDQGGQLKPYVAAHAAIHFPSSAGAVSAQKGSLDCQKATVSTKEACVLTSSLTVSLTEVPEPAGDDSSTHAISLTSGITKGVSPWSLPEDCDKTPFTMMEPGGISSLTDDCLMQPSRTCLGCFMESKDSADTEPGMSLKMAEMNREYETCSISDMGMHGIMPSDTCQYGDQLLSDQLLSFSVHKGQTTERRDVEKTESDSEDPASKNLYEGLLLDKCNGEEALLPNPGQDWGYFESFISESKIELLDLCSKNELSVNLFSEEDVDNYMFDDDDDDSTLSSDVCSLKIRYESFQDNMREKTNVLQEETQLNFFPTVLINCTKKDSGTVKKNVEGLLKEEEGHPVGDDSRGDENYCPTDVTPDGSPKRSYVFDFSNSTEDSGEYSDDSSCTGSSSDTLQEVKGRSHLFSKENCSSSSQLNYRLRAKRKVRYSEDYLYDVDSIENEKNVEKREKLPAGPKEEEDDDWCPNKRRKSSRKEPPVIIKYIIINRFKGERHMLVKLGKIDPSITTVKLTEGKMNQYEKLAPLKHFWEKRLKEQEERRRLAVGDKHNFRLNGRGRPFSLSPPKRKYKIANRLRIQRIQTVEQSPNKQGGGIEDEAALTGVPLTTVASSRASTLDANDITHTSAPNSRSQERDDKRIRNKVVRIRKFKSEARLRSKKMKDMQEDGRSMTNQAGIYAVLQNQDSVGSVKDEAMDSAASSPHLCENHTANASKKSTFVSATCSPDKTTPSVNVATSVPVVPGGYLQTLLDASDTSSSSGMSFFPQQPPRQYPVGLSQEEKQFTSLQLAQSCVLSPPSESELQQSPQNCQIEPNFTHMWHSQLGPSQAPFAPDIPETPIMPNSFSGPLPVPMADNLSVSGYSQLNLESNRLLYEKNYLPEQPLQSDTDYQACQVTCGERHLQLQRGTLNTDNGRLISFDSVGSLSATSSNYSSLSLKSCEKEGEDDMNDNFLAHCSPKLVIQQSVDAITPLRESTDLLDISNFTPDKFRHSSLSEMSPPDTPSLSPQVVGPEIKGGGAPKMHQETCEMASTPEVKWNCNLIPQPEQQPNVLASNSHQFQFHTFSDDDGVGLVEKGTTIDNFDKQGNQIMNVAKGSRSKKKTTSRQVSGQGTSSDQKGAKKNKAPKAAKGERTKTPRQNSRTPKKFKPPSDGKAGKGQAGSSKLLHKGHNIIDNIGVSHGGSMGLSRNWALIKDANTGWADTNNLLDDDQREFEEPSNILSNIASGMAEVQRFMMASIEPLWCPASGLCQPPEPNSLKLKTLKILAGTSPDSKRRGTPSTNGPAHKKMYRHKTSAKFPRVDSSKGKRAERDPNKDLALIASYEKLRIWGPSIAKSSYNVTQLMSENYTFLDDFRQKLYFGTLSVGKHLQLAVLKGKRREMLLETQRKRITQMQNKRNKATGQLFFSHEGPVPD